MNSSSKYLRLFGSLFFLLMGMLLSMVIVFVVIRFLFGLMSYIPWALYVYMILILLLPATVFITGFIVYAKRTATHPSKTTRVISYMVFTAALVAWVVYLILDIIIFYRHAYNSIGKYHSYDMLFLFLNVAGLFIVGILQALTTGREEDWMEKNLREHNNESTL